MDKTEQAYAEEIVRLLKIIATNAGATGDDSYQFPKPTESKFQLAAGEIYTRELYPQSRLMRLTISAPADVVIVIHKDGIPWRRYNGIFTYSDGVNGEYFNKFTITAQNTGTSPCIWNVEAVFG